jgi:outer membrane protein assembly factor BamC
MHLNKIFSIAALSAAVSLAACTSTKNPNKIDYKSQKKGVSLEVPPGLSDYDKNNQFDLSKGVSASTVNATPTSNAVATPLLLQAKDMRIEKAGDTHWLVINRPAEQVWPVLSEFWEENGFSIRSSSAKLGILETDWAENRAALPQGGLRKVIGKALDGLYETGMRDMFKTRIERTGAGVEVYISHRGMEEVYTSASKDNTTWQPRAVDSQLETEFLRRLMVKLGTDEKQAQTALNNSINTAKAVSISGANLIVSDNMENTWRRVGLSLDRVGLSVTDRNYASRIYYVTPSPDDRGIFRKSFGKLNETYQVKFKEINANQIQVSFLDKNDAVMAGSDVEKVLKNLQKIMK